MPKTARAPLTWHRHGDAILLDGAIDERARLAELVGEARGGELAIDCAAVSFVNSLGVRAWIALVAGASAANVKLELRRVAEPLVHQLNLVLAARAPVTSFFAPYVCEHCDGEANVLIDVAAHRDDLVRGAVPARGCASCKRAMTFGQPIDLYLQFLRG